MVCSTSAKAATYEWLAGLFIDDGFYDDVSKWGLVSGTGSPPPGVGDTAEFNLSSTYDVWIQTGATSQTWALDRIRVIDGNVAIIAQHTLPSVEATVLDLTTGAGTIDIDGGNLLLDNFSSNGEDTFSVNLSGDFVVRDGVATIREAVFSVPDLILGRQNGTAGEVVVEFDAELNVTATFDNIFGVSAGQGTLTIKDGTVDLAGKTRLGDSSSAASNGAIHLSGSTNFTDSFLNLDSLELGGIAGTGSLTATNRSRVTQSGASTMEIGGTGGAGAVTVEDQALIDTGTGNITISSVGTLNVAGGTFQADGFLNAVGGTLNLSGGELVINNGFDARNSGGIVNLTGGTIRVQGGLAQLETSLNFGGPSSSERGMVIVKDGNQAEVQFAARAGNSAGTFGGIELEGVGTRLRGTGGGAGADLVIGGAGDGTLQVKAGAEANFRDDFVIGEQAGSNGQAFVFGQAGAARSKVEVTIGGANANVSVGRAGTGLLDISDGGLVVTGGDVFLASLPTGNATINVGDLSQLGPLDATLQSADDMFVGGGSTTAGGTAALNLDVGGLVIVPDLLKIYGGGTVNIGRGRIEVGSIDFQPGATWSWGSSFTNGTLNFTGNANFNTNLVNGLFGVSGVHNDGTIEVDGTMTVSTGMTMSNVLSAANLIVNAPVAVVDPGIFADADVTVTGTATINDTVTHTSGEVSVDNLVLGTNVYNLQGGKLSLRTGTMLLSQLNFTGGTLEVTAAQFTVGASGILGSSVNAGSGHTYSFLGDVDVASGGLLRTSGGIVDVTGNLNVLSGGNLDSSSTLRVRSDLIIAPGIEFTNNGIVTLLGSGTSSFSGEIDNPTDIHIDKTSVSIPAEGLILNGGGQLTALTDTVIDGASVGKISNTDNRITGRVADNLELRNLQLNMGANAEIGGNVTLNNVDTVGGAVNSSGVGLAIFSGNSTIDGVVEMTGGVGILGARILPTGDVRLQPVSQFSVSPTTLDLDGRLRAEAGADLTLLLPGTYDWSDGTVSLADDTTHTVNPGVVVILTTPLEYDTLTVDDNSFGFFNAVHGADPVISTGQALHVSGTTTLSSFLVLDGGLLRTGSIQSIERLDFRSGELHLTNDDFLVGSGALGPVFSVGANSTLTIDNQIEISPGNRLVATSGTVNGNTLENSGDFDLIESTINFSGTANNFGDINAIDSTLTFASGLSSTGTLNLVNSTINGPVSILGVTASAGANTFNGVVSGDGNFSGSGEIIFADRYAPGTSAAQIDFDGGVTLDSTATLEIELGGLLAGEFDQLIILGDASLDGALDVSLISGFSPLPGDAFEFLTSADVQGTFGSLTFPTLSGGLQWFIDYQPNSVSLIVGSPGDFDFDGDVDGADFLSWQRGESLNPLSPSDLTDWQANYGEVASPLSASTAVPEPNTLAGLAVLLASQVCRCRCRSRVAKRT